jgi:hypothetical protein
VIPVRESGQNFIDQQVYIVIRRITMYDNRYPQNRKMSVSCRRAAVLSSHVCSRPGNRLSKNCHEKTYRCEMLESEIMNFNFFADIGNFVKYTDPLVAKRRRHR